MEDRPPADAELVVRVRGGDDAAFEALVTTYGELAFRVAYLILADADDARDAVQEGFVKAHRALGTFRDGAPLRPWLLEIVANTARNRRRAAGRRAQLELRASQVRPQPSTAPSAEAIVLDDEQRRTLLAAINGLDADDRLVIAARYFLDLSEAETAALAGIARGTVKSRLSRARARLAQRLRDAGTEWIDG